MNIGEVKKCVKYVMSLGETPILVGHAGVGKTEMIKQIGNETNRKVVVLLLSQMEPGDLLGFPSKDEKTGKTKYYAPDWWPEDGNTIVFLDEINRAHITVRNAVMQLLLDRRIHNNILPKGTWVCAAMNPETDEYEVEPIIDQAFVDRFVWLKVKPDYESWRNFMLTEKRINNIFDQAVSNIVKLDPAVFNNSDFQIPEIRPTPRSLERLYKVIVNAPQELTNFLNELAYGICGKVGVKIVKEYFDRSKAELTYEDLLAGDVAKTEASNSALRTKALDALVSYFISKADFVKEEVDVSTKELENVVKCLKLFKKEELGPLFRMTSDKQKAVLKILKNKSKEFRKFFVDLVMSFGDFGTAIEKLG